MTAAIEAGWPVGLPARPSAVTTALAVSGLPADRFCFEGFPPRKHSARRGWLAGLAAEPRTVVFFESPRRLADCSRDACDELGPQAPGCGVPGADKGARRRFAAAPSPNLPTGRPTVSWAKSPWSWPVPLRRLMWTLWWPRSRCW